MISIVFLFAACSSPEGGAESPPVGEVSSGSGVGAGAGAGPSGTGTGTRTGTGWDTAGWQAILDEYATDDARFRYAALHGNEAHVALLGELVASIATADPSSWSRDEQLAFYINAYNVLVIRTVVDRWPIESVMRSEGFFDGVTYPVAGTDRTLNALENEVIRAESFSEPRIHFAVNCASAGCPQLSRSVYTAEDLETQLARQANAFVRAESRIDRASGSVAVSPIFDWFAADFERGGGVRAFLADHLEGEDAAFVRDEATTIRHFEYDWELNSL